MRDFVSFFYNIARFVKLFSLILYFVAVLQLQTEIILLS